MDATRSRPGFVSGDFLTASYRISGDVKLHGEPLLDQLNDHMALFIALKRMFVSPLLDPTVLTGNFEEGHVRKSNLGLVVLKTAKAGLPHREGRYVGRDHVDHEMLIVAAGFELRGVLRLHPTVDVPKFVRTTPEHFIPLFDATATMTVDRDVMFEGAAILLNRNQIEVFSVLGKVRE